MRAGELKKGGYVVIKGHPCKVADLSTSKTGKHGHAKISIVAIDVLTGKKYEDMAPTSHNVNVPVITRNDYQVVALDGDFLSLMDANGNMKDDVAIPEGEFGDKRHSTFSVFLKTLFINPLSATTCPSAAFMPTGSESEYTPFSSVFERS